MPPGLTYHYNTPTLRIPTYADFCLRSAILRRTYSGKSPVSDCPRKPIQLYVFRRNHTSLRLSEGKWIKPTYSSSSVCCIVAYSHRFVKKILLHSPCFVRTLFLARPIPKQPSKPDKPEQSQLRQANQGYRSAQIVSATA